MPHAGPTELIIVLLIVTMVFGVGKLPQVGSAMGQAIREFRGAQDGREPSPPHDAGRDRWIYTRSWTGAWESAEVAVQPAPEPKEA